MMERIAELTEILLQTLILSLGFLAQMVLLALIVSVLFALVLFLRILASFIWAGLRDGYRKAMRRE